LTNWNTGQVIRSRGVSRQQLYLYQVMGLIEPAGRTETGRWIYDQSVLERLTRIGALRQQGLTLQQIREQMRADGSLLATTGG
jgi:DNA-binding transcriptional MerR regulator